jgi:hypothetical protein
MYRSERSVSVAKQEVFFLTDAPLPLAEEEYRALRATIRERGTLRPIVMTLTVVSWAGVSVWLQASGAAPLLSLVALVILDAGFEAVFSIHVGVERVGRYLQVRYESADGPRWEHTAMEAPPAAPSKPTDALFSWVFLAACGLNLVLACWLAAGAALTGQAPEIVSTAGSAMSAGAAGDMFTWSPLPVAMLAVLVVAHAAFVLRILGAKKFAAGQRTRELEFFRRTLSN